MNSSGTPAAAAAGGINQRIPNPQWVVRAQGDIPGFSRDMTTSSPSSWNRFTATTHGGGGGGGGGGISTTGGAMRDQPQRRLHRAAADRQLQHPAMHRGGSTSTAVPLYWGASQVAETSQRKSEIGPVHTVGPEANPCFSNRSVESRNTTSGIIPGSTSAGASRKKKWRPHCRHPTCLRPASYASDSGQDPIFCEKHKVDGMQNVVHPNRGECNEDGCKRVSAYASTAATFASYCYLHKKEGMVKVRDGIGTRCENAECVKQASFALEGERYPRFCKNHKEEEMINIRNNRCIAEACHRGASFAPVGERRGLYCGEHKAPGMINTRRRPRCIAPGCNSREPVFMAEGQQAPRYCVEHKEEGMQDVRQAVRMVCAFPDCKRPPMKGSTDESLLDFCDAHQEALDSSSSVPRSKIGECMTPSCASPPSYGWETGMVAVMCELHAQKGMVNVVLSGRGDPMPPSGRVPRVPVSSDALARAALHVLGPAPPDFTWVASQGPALSVGLPSNHRDREGLEKRSPFESATVPEHPPVRPAVRVFTSRTEGSSVVQQNRQQQQPLQLAGSAAGHHHRAQRKPKDPVPAAEKLSIRAMRVEEKPSASSKDEAPITKPLDPRPNISASGGPELGRRTMGPALQILSSASNTHATTVSKARAPSSEGHPIDRGITLSVNGDGPTVRRGSLTFFPADFALGNDDDDLFRPSNRSKRSASPHQSEQSEVAAKESPFKRVKEEIGLDNDAPVGTRGTSSVARALAPRGKDCQGWQAPELSGTRRKALTTAKKLGLEDYHPPGYTRTEFFYTLVGALTSTNKKRADSTSASSTCASSSSMAVN